MHLAMAPEGGGVSVSHERLIFICSFLLCPQEAQVTIECAIPQKFHRSVMGPKGSRIQQITRDYTVQIKFPDREESPGGSPWGALWPEGGGQEGGRGRWLSHVLVKLCLAWCWTLLGVPGACRTPRPWAAGQRGALQGS